MPRRKRGFFAKLTHFFRQHFGSSRSTSSSSNSDVFPAGSGPIQPSQPSAATPLPPPQPLIPSTSQLPTTPPSLHPPPHSNEHGEPTSDLTLPFAHYNAPAPLLNSAVQSSIPDQTSPSLQPPASHAPTSRSGEHARFTGAHDFVFYNPQFNDTSPSGSGIEKLLKHSMPDAFHNSAARYPPPKCHLGTRNDYISRVMDWALGNGDDNKPILWMRGPFGIGKSAVAQSCAEALQHQNKLLATLFFSRSNADRDDPRRVFTSIAYQIAAICESFSNIIDARIRKDPAIAAKSLSTQFEELLVDSLNQIDITRSGIKGRVVIIDGLDECRGSPEQCEIIRVIAASARDQTTPFRWFITSRPEDPIIRTMKSPTVFPVSVHLELPVSRKIDHEILLYLTDEFNKIRESHGLAESWPSEAVLALIVDRTAGLWIYVTTITRFITDENSLGPEDQLRIVLAFLKDVSAKVGSDNPLTEMDFFYTLIMQRVPPKIRTIVRKILLLDSVVDLRVDFIPNVLGLSEEQLRRSCTSIQSVMELQGSKLDDLMIHFHHASFLDFMKDPKRSKELCISGDFLIEYRRERLDWLHQVCSRSTGPEGITFPPEPVLVEGLDRNKYYSANVECFWFLCGVKGCPVDYQTTASLAKIPFRILLRLTIENNHWIGPSLIRDIKNNLPSELRDKIIRQEKCPTPGCTNTDNVWILGHGENETVVTSHHSGGLEFKNNQNPPPGQCFCGSQIKRDV